MPPDSPSAETTYAYLTTNLIVRIYKQSWDWAIRDDDADRAPEP